MTSEDEKRIPDDEITLVGVRLHDYPYSRKYLGKYIRTGFETPFLGENILFDVFSVHESETCIEAMERVLEDGAKNCAGFSGIIKGNLPLDTRIANAQILDKLAEVEAYRWLRQQDIHSISKLSENGEPTLDFVGEFQLVKYVIEVTRLGVPQSDRKKVEPISREDIPMGQSGEPVPLTMWSSNPATRQRIVNSIQAAIRSKNRQIRTFIEINPGYKCVLVISTGRGLFLSRELVREEVGGLPSTWRRSLGTAWEGLDPTVSSLLEAVVLLDGRNERVSSPSEQVRRPLQR